MVWSGDILCPGEEGVGREGQSTESLEGQAHGLGLHPGGSGEPLKVIDQGSDICFNWMAEIVPGWEDTGRRSMWGESKGLPPKS